ncbi:extracellular solute-binding protein [Anaerocolumna jejuensis]|uniref:extracellular solute-binding protein n=1 Tax=Anaerocolumna jejuensis TaxID=259063 RepID=UPI003F7CCAA4
MKKKILAGLLALTMAAGLISGCAKTKDQNDGSKDSTATSGAENPSGDNGGKNTASKYQTTYGSKKFDNVSITVELFDRSNAPKGSTITDNRWTKYVKQEMNKVGINVEFIPVSRGDEVTKMQAMMASGTAPDITLTYTYAYAEQYFKQGGIWDLSQFIDGEDQAKNLKAYVGQDVLDIARSTDNALYGVVAKRAITAKSNLFIRKDWLDKLNLQIPITPDELYNVIDKMKNNNPDARNTTIGAIIFNAWNTKLAFSKLAGSEKDMAIAYGDDAIADYYDPGNREYYRFMNKLYNNGLLNQEYYAMTEDNFKSDIVTGDVGFFECNVNYAVDVMRGSLLKTLQENVPGADIVSIPPLKNVNDGKQYSASYAPGGLIAFAPLTASAEKVEAAVTYLDWMSTKEGGFTLYHGIEGEHFNYDADGVPVVKDADYNAKDKDWIRADLFLTGNQGYFNSVEDFSAATAKEAPGFEDHVAANYENALTGTLVYDPTYTSPSTSNLITDIGLVRDDYTVQVVTCPTDKFDATYDKYMKELKDAGIQKIIDERAEYFDGVYGK